MNVFVKQADIRGTYFDRALIDAHLIDYLDLFAFVPLGPSLMHPILLFAPPSHVPHFYIIIYYEMTRAMKWQGGGGEIRLTKC